MQTLVDSRILVDVESKTLALETNVVHSGLISVELLLIEFINGA